MKKLLKWMINTKPSNEMFTCGILHRTLLILETSLWKESLNSYCEQFHHYQQNKRKFKQLLWTVPPLSTKQRKFKQLLWTIPQLSTKQRKFKQLLWTIPPLSTKQRKFNYRLIIVYYRFCKGEIYIASFFASVLFLCF